MKLHFIADHVDEITVDTILIFLKAFTEIKGKFLEELDYAAGGAMTTLLEADEFSGKYGEMTTLVNTPGFKTRRVVLVGMGDKRDLTHESFRKMMGTASRYGTVTRTKHLAVYFNEFDDAAFYQATIEGFLLGSYKYLGYKSGDDEKQAHATKEITFVIDKKPGLRKLEKAVLRGQVIAEGQILTRDLGTITANDLTPALYVNRIRKLAEEHKLKMEVLDTTALKKEKMGAILAVGQGSANPPRLVVLRYNNGPKNQAPIVLVGKGITFDSGGLSLKTADKMPEMKNDMAGSAAVLSAIVTAARLKIPRNIVGLLAMAENMPSGNSYRPGDVIKTRKGLTVEIMNTDAEGRLVLADALDYAGEFKPQAVIDIATLTGASLYILGYEGAPVLGNRTKMIDMVYEASMRTGERVWRLPIWDEHRQAMKSSLADLQNSGGRPAGTITAAAFLENFVGDWPWLHIDIAYVDNEIKGRPYLPKGITGFGTRLLVNMLENWKKV